MDDLIIEKPDWFDIKNYDYLSNATTSQWASAFRIRINLMRRYLLKQEVPFLWGWVTHLEAIREGKYASNHNVRQKELTDKEYKRPFEKDFSPIMSDEEKECIEKCFKEMGLYNNPSDEDIANYFLMSKNRERTDKFTEDVENPQPFLEIETPSLDFYARSLALRSGNVHERTGLSYEEIYTKKKARLQRHFDITNHSFDLIMLSHLEPRMGDPRDENYQEKLNKAKNNWSDYSSSKLTRPKQRLLRVDLDTPDETLKKLFQKWLEVERKKSPLGISRRGAKPKNVISKDILRKWHRNRLIPLFDLTILNNCVYGRVIKKTVLADWLYGDLNYANPSQQFSKAMRLMDSALEIYEPLLLQASGEETFHK